MLKSSLIIKPLVRLSALTGLGSPPSPEQRRSESNSAPMQLPESGKIQLNSWWITGFAPLYYPLLMDNKGGGGGVNLDGEGSFSIYIVKNNEFKVGWRIHLFFEITLHVKDQTLLELIKSYFGVGFIKLRKNNSVSYTVSSYKDLAKIIEHFEKYPLITKKFADYELWKEVYFLMVNKEHRVPPLSIERGGGGGRDVHPTLSR